MLVCHPHTYTHLAESCSISFLTSPIQLKWNFTSRCCVVVPRLLQFISSWFLSSSKLDSHRICWRLWISTYNVIFFFNDFDYTLHTSSIWAMYEGSVASSTFEMRCWIPFCLHKMHTHSYKILKSSLHTK